MKISLAHNYPEPDVIQFAQEVGCKWLYIDICWPRIQPEPETFDFSYYDPIVERCAQAGINLVATIASQRVTFPDGYWIWNNHRGMMPDMDAWSRFVGTTTARYQHAIKYWEIWSEPNCVACNPMGYYRPQVYRQLLQTASSTIRAIDSSAKIVMGGLWFANMLPYFLENFFADAAIFDSFDIFNWHFYLIVSRRESIPFKVWEEPLDHWMKYFKKFLPSDFPIWMTEFGIPTRQADSEFLYSRTRGQIVGLEEAEQAEWFGQFLEKADRDWGIELLVWLMLADRVDPTYYYSNATGILRPDGSPKPIKQLIGNYLAAQPQ